MSIKAKLFTALSTPFTALAGNIDDAVTKKVVMTLVRKAALLLAAWLVQQGYLDTNHVQEFAGYFVGLVSIFSGTQNAVNHG